METYASYTIKDLGMGDIQVTASSELTKNHLRDVCEHFEKTVPDQLHMEDNALIVTNSRIAEIVAEYFRNFDESTLIGDDCADAFCPCNQ